MSEEITPEIQILTANSSRSVMDALAGFRAHERAPQLGAIPLGEKNARLHRRHSLGSIGRIVMVHFRNVRGEFPRFQEAFVDERDVDMFRAMQACRDVGFKDPFSLEHSPLFPGAEIAIQAFFAGYLRGLIQAMYR